MTFARTLTAIAMTAGLTLSAFSSAQNSQSASQRALAPRIDQLSWLTGCWSLQKGNATVEEHWLAPAGGAMLGLSRTIREGKMTEFEFMSIREVNGKLSFVAVPSGQREAVFPFVRGSASELVFEELKHDFPQRVVYRNVNGVLAARIEGEVNGTPRSVDSPYQRCALKEKTAS